MAEEDKESGSSSHGDINSFTSTYELLSTRIFLQKGDLKKVPPSVFPSAAITKYITDILLSVARVGVSLQSDKTILSVISPGPEYHPEFKKIVFKAFSMINAELPEYVIILLLYYIMIMIMIMIIYSSQKMIHKLKNSCTSCLITLCIYLRNQLP